MALLWLMPLFGVGALFLYHWLKTRSQLYKSIEKYFPGPYTKPFVGNALDFPMNSLGITQKLAKYAKQYERFYRIWLGPDAFVLLYDPEDVEVILSSTSQITKSDVYRFTIPWIGYGLLTSTGPKWKSRRRIITPTFHFKILEDFVDVFEANGKILIEKLRSKVGQPAFDIYPYANLYALDNICETAMGTSINAQKDSDSSYVQAIKSVCNIVTMRTFQPWLTPDALFNLSKYKTIQKEALSIIHNHTRQTIKSRRVEIKQSASTTNGTMDADLNVKRKLAFLDLLLESAEVAALSDEDIQEEVDTFMFEGHDTVTSGIAFTLYAISKNPHVQEKVYQEQREIFGDSDRPARHSDFSEMKYLEKVIKEAQRLYPSVPIIGRRIEQDITLRGGAVLPKGCQAIVYMTGLHMNPNVWSDPETFDPERFAVENSAKRSPYAHVPFSAGPRNCIGQRFAYMELKASISKVIRNFKLLPCEKHKDATLVSELVTISSNGINLQLEERTQ